MSLPTSLQAARLRLSMSHPYMGSVLWAVVPVSSPGLGTLGVDKYGRLYYDAEKLETWSPGEREAVLYHELGHLIRDHAGRLDPLTPDTQRANVAGDLEINDDIRSEGLNLPEGAVYPSTFDLPAQRTAEEYLDLLPVPPPCPGGGGPGDGKKGPEPKPCGSGSTGKPEPWEAPAPGTVGRTGEPAPEGMGPAELGTIRRATAEAIREEASKSRGTVPAGLQRWAESYLHPQINWRAALRSAVRSAVARASGMDDYSFHRPSRRQIPRVILPSMYRPVPQVAVITDTSGSMGTEELAKALAEIGGVLKTLGTPIEVLSVDAAVHTRQRVTRTRQISLVGGGGTDMGAGLEALLERGPVPDVIVVVTDGYTPWPDRAPANTQVVVCLVGDGQSPRWARTVKVGELR